MRSFPLIIIPCMLLACTKLEPTAPAEDGLLDGPIDGLAPEETARFLRGDAAFTDAVFNASNGLGPLFVGTRCASCHAGDGPGHPFSTLTRFGQSDASGNHYLDQGGPQLQHRALPGVQPETLPPGAPSTRLLPPLNTGLGLIDAVRDADILAWADEHDADGDGISGRPDRVPMKEYSTPRPAYDVVDGLVIGRYGRKASVYDLLQQTANAYNQDIGVVSVFEPVDPYTHQAQAPEIPTSTVQDVVFYLHTLKPPAQRNADDPEVMAGEQVFTAVGCARCHRPSFTTGDHAIAALAHRAFRPFTDLLLHDMGPELDDGYTEGSASSAEWRTAPLWGLGLFPQSQGGQYFLLHDGRAHGIEEAVAFHGGEGQAARAAFHALSSTDRTRLRIFLESL